jgi:hypothetical protein
MYINYEILTSKGLSLHESSVLQLIKQNRIHPLSEVISFETMGTDMIDKFSNLGYIDYVKAKKGQPVLETIRATKKAVEVLEDIETPIVTEDILKMRDYLQNMYLNHEDEDRVIGNKKLIGIYISIMINHLNLTLHEFYYLCELFLEHHKFTKKLENIFYDRNKNRFKEFKNNVEESPLFQFYDLRKGEVEYYWKLKIKE